MARLAPLIVLASLVLCPSHAGAAFTPLDQTGVVHTDGRRYAAYERPAGVTRILDTVRDTSVEVRHPGTACNLTGVGGGQVLWGCAEAVGQRHFSQAPRLLSLRTGRVHVPAGWPELAAAHARSDGSLDIRGIGRRWIHLRVTYYRAHREIFLDWRTGEVVSGDFQGPLDPATVYSADARRPLVRMCRPLRHRPNRSHDELLGSFSKVLEPFLYARPFGVAPPVHEGAALVLRGCGRRPRRRLSRCPCGSVELSNGLVAWSQPSGRRAAVYTYETRARRRTRIGSVPRTRGNPQLPLVAYTATRVFASEPETGRSYSAPRLSRRPRPR